MSMNKQTFMLKLKQGLNGLSEEDTREILYDYEEHFEIGRLEGRTEEEIAVALGNPESLAKELRASIQITRAKNDSSVKNIFSALGATIGLGFFNLIFVLGPFIALASILLAFLVVTISFYVTGLAFVVASFLQNILSHTIEVFANPWINVFIGLGFISLGVSFTYLTKAVGGVFKKATIRYLSFNVRIIKRRGNA